MLEDLDKAWMIASDCRQFRNIFINKLSVRASEIPERFLSCGNTRLEVIASNFGISLNLLLPGLVGLRGFGLLVSEPGSALPCR